jgi:hypothetical protein
MSTRSPALWAVVAALAATPAAPAQPVLYTFSGNANGSLGGQPFSNAAFSIEAVADLSLIALQSPGVFAVPTAADIAISGFSRAALLFTNRVVANQNFARIGIGDLDQNVAVLFIDNVAVQTYGLNTTIGPLTGPTILTPAASYPTSAGLMNLSAVFNASFSAVVVPEPSALALVGLACCWWRGRRYVRQTLAPQHSPPPTAA